ncbi:hypothetical protein GRJ2_000554400 [Grus japonensis]|uniref:Uncharacterized protein n=1 Tax=Grus japonensis TaxID=30415 RepID=A0ABC9W6R9_GRUJA
MELKVPCTTWCADTYAGTVIDPVGKCHVTENPAEINVSDCQLERGEERRGEERRGEERRGEERRGEERREEKRREEKRREEKRREEKRREEKRREEKRREEKRRNFHCVPEADKRREAMHVDSGLDW